MRFGRILSMGALVCALAASAVYAPAVEAESLGPIKFGEMRKSDERVLAGSDCGFETFARREPTVAPSIVWAKFRAMAAGARIATEWLWK